MEKAARASPGVGKYNLDKKEQIKGCSKMTERKASLSDETAFRAEQSPSPTKYSMKTPLESYKLASVNSLKIIPPQNGALKDEGRSSKIRKDNTPSPCSYDTQQNFLKKTSTAVKGSPQFGFAKGTRATYLDAKIASAK